MPVENKGRDFAVNKPKAKVQAPLETKVIYKPA
jgi:hypothetical protein